MLLFYLGTVGSGVVYSGHQCALNFFIPREFSLDPPSPPGGFQQGSCGGQPTGSSLVSLGITRSAAIVYTWDFPMDPVLFLIHIDTYVLDIYGIYHDILGYLILCGKIFINWIRCYIMYEYNILNSYIWFQMWLPTMFLAYKACRVQTSFFQWIRSGCHGRPMGFWFCPPGCST